MLRLSSFRYWQLAGQRLALALAFALSLGAAAGWPARAASAGSLCVNQGGTGGCFGLIADALAAAHDGDTIHIAGASSPYPERLTITKSLTLMGDSAATTIIDGSAAGQVIRISGAITVTLSNLTIQNGQGGPGSTADSYGAGIHNVNATLTLSHVVVSGNHTGSGSCCGGDGGGIFNDHGRLTITDSLISGNTTSDGVTNGVLANSGGLGGNGAGIDNVNADLVINGSTVSDNFAGRGGNGDANGGHGGNGGGIFSSNGTVTIRGSTIRDNAAGNGGDAGNGGQFGGNGGDGGGIFSSINAVTITDSTLAFNASGAPGAGPATGVSGNGAGLIVETEPVNFKRALNISNSTFSNNQTGRGLPNSAGGDGGGIFSSSGMTVTLTNVTLAFNTVDIGQMGAAIANKGLANLKNSLLVHNTDTSGPDALHDCSGSFNSLGYNLIMEPDCAVSPSPTGTTGDQFFVRGAIVAPLANNGGPTQTHALLPGSLAVDAADNSACSPADQRGFARPVFGGVALRCDVGAFELYLFGVRLPLLMR